MDDINPGVDLSILDKANEAQDTYITNPNMKTADAYIQALQETTMTLINSILMLAGPEFRKLKYLGCHHQYRIDHAETAKTKSGRNREGQT